MHTESRPPTFKITVFWDVMQIRFVDKDKHVSGKSVASIVTILSEFGDSRFLRNVCVTSQTTGISIATVANN
jgi:hypothetical protein